MTLDNKTRPLLLWSIAGACLLAAAVLGGVPAGVVMLGALSGFVAAASSVALILVYRTHGFLHVAQPSMALLAGVTVARVADSSLGFWGGLGAGLVVGIGSGLLCHLALWRFRNRPALTLVAASVGLAYLFGAARAGILFSGGLPRPVTPFEFSFDVFPVLFKAPHLLAALLAGAGIAAARWFYSSSLSGLAARATGSNSERAACLGIPRRSVSALTWLCAGVLATAAGAMTFHLAGPALDTGPGASLALFALLPAVAARMSGLIAATALSVWTGVAHQTVLWVTDRAAVADVALLIVVLSVLALDREATQALRVKGKALADVARMRVRAPGLALLTLTGIAVAGFTLWNAGPSTAQRIGTVGVFALAGAAVSLAAVFTGTLSLGHWAVVGTGAFAAAASGPRFGFAGALVAGAVAGGFASLISALPASGRGPFPYAVATLAFAVAAQGLFTLSPILRKSDAGLAPEWPFLGRNAGTSLLIALALAAALWLSRWLRTSRVGLQMLAVRDSQNVAAAYGISPSTPRALAYLISGVVAGVAGSLYLFNQSDLHPASLGSDRSILLTAMVVVGGAGSVWAGAVGAAAVSGSTLFLSGWLELLGTGAGILALLMLFPGGFASVPHVVINFFLRKQPPAAPDPGEDSPLLSVRNLEVAYSKTSPAVSGSFSVQPGEVVSLMGGNGSGKSTVFKAIAGLVPYSGSIRVGQAELGGLYPEEIARAGVILVDGDNPVFDELTVRENLRVASFNSHSRRSDFEARLKTHIASIPRLEGMLEKKAGNLSGGEQRLVALCQTLFQRPRVLMLDELDAGLDFATDRISRELERAFASRGVGVIRVAHSSAAPADRRLEVRDGHVTEEIVRV